MKRNINMIISAGNVKVNTKPEEIKGPSIGMR